MLRAGRNTGQYMLGQGRKPEFPGENHPYCCEKVKELEGAAFCDVAVPPSWQDPSAVHLRSSAPLPGVLQASRWFCTPCWDVGRCPNNSGREACGETTQKEPALGCCRCHPGGGISPGSVRDSIFH
ncbi:hypothetical protein E2C01_056551 [Portunus trituberculatus]|uniref:Uncharacterized protein n=1 Tax=Portunus trituberculatus TaxID=210409 RepID=A0A5B7GY06_PORTR|nr:hypothetical protein [Portunus trituberculatus]